MRRNRRSVCALAFAAALHCLAPVGAFAFDQETQRILAPGKTLKAGLYPGTPTSILAIPGSGPSVGVGYELGKELALRLGVPYEPVVFSKNTEVLAAVKSGAVDVIFTNASPARARDMDFGPPYLDIELGYLTPRNGRLVSMSEVDVKGRNIGVTEGSSSDAFLSRELKNATVVKVETSQLAIEMLANGKLDAYATNKATLFEMAEKLPGSKILEGNWGLERHAIAIPKGRDAGLAFIREFTGNVKSEGLVKAAMDRAGLRGAIVAGEK